MDELIYGETLDPAPRVNEIPCMRPEQFMESAGLTSKEQVRVRVRVGVRVRVRVRVRVSLGLGSQCGAPAPWR